MKLFNVNWFKVMVVGLVLLINGLVMPTALADRGQFTQTPDYAAVTQAIADLTNPATPSELSPEATQQKLADLRFQKYILETSAGRSRYENRTAAVLGIYAKPKKSTLAPTLYFLGAGQVTDDDFEAVAVYLPAGSQVTLGGAVQEITEPVAVSFVPGTQLIVTADPDTGAIEFNAPASGVLKAADTDWTIPTLTAAEVTTQVPNAPID